MVARVLKWKARAVLRKIQQQAVDSQHYKDGISQFINIVFVKSKESDDYWINELIPELREKFTGEWLNNDKQIHAICLKRYRILFSRFSCLIGLKITKLAKNRISYHQKQGLNFPEFDSIDIAQFIPVLKTTISSNFIKANYYILKSLTELQSQEPDSILGIHYKELALKFLKKCLINDPLNNEVLYLIAEMTDELRLSLSDTDIQHYFKLALEANPKDASACAQYAVSLCKRLKGTPSPSQKLQIEQLFLSALELNPVDPKILLEFGKFLWLNCEEYDWANHFFVSALTFVDLDIENYQEIYVDFLKQLNAKNEKDVEKNNNPS